MVKAVVAVYNIVNSTYTGLDGTQIDVDGMYTVVRGIQMFNDEQSLKIRYYDL